MATIAEQIQNDAASFWPTESQRQIDAAGGVWIHQVRKALEPNTWMDRARDYGYFIFPDDSTGVFVLVSDKDDWWRFYSNTRFQVKPGTYQQILWASEQ